MSFTLAWIASAIDSVAEFVRSMLPLQSRQIASNWLIFSGILAIGAALLAIGHLIFRERPKIAWEFSTTGYPIIFNGRMEKAGGPWSYTIDGIQLRGENVSGHDLHQIDGEIQFRDGKTLPLFVVIDGLWRPLSDLGKLPPRAILRLGAQFRPDGFRWQEFSTEMTQDRFLKEFGGMTLRVSIEGSRSIWTYSVDDVRSLIEAYKRANEDAYFSNPAARPQATLKAS